VRDEVIDIPSDPRREALPARDRQDQILLPPEDQHWPLILAQARAEVLIDRRRLVRAMRGTLMGTPVKAAFAWRVGNGAS
jgi:hypothetical protein